MRALLLIPRAPAGLAGLAFTLLLGGCDDKAAASDSKPAEPKTIETIEGTVTVGAKAAKVTGCKVKARDPGTVLELTLDNGMVLVNDAMEGMFWRRGDGERTRLECERSAAQSDAGSAFGNAWWKGKLELQCTHADGEIKAELTLDCGAADRPSNRVENSKRPS
jgi:hypothetical protein